MDNGNRKRSNSSMTYIEYVDKYDLPPKKPELKFY